MILLKKRSILTVTFIILLGVAVLSMLKFVNVEANDTKEIYTYYTSYEIQPGDTLSSIAEKYSVNGDLSIKDYIETIKKNNHLKSDRITSGNNLIITYYSNEKK